VIVVAVSSGLPYTHDMNVKASHVWGTVTRGKKSG